MCLPKSPSSQFVLHAPLSYPNNPCIIPPSTSSSAGFCVPILQPCVGLWSLGPDMWKQSQQREMKWYIELIKRWISNDQDLMSNQNTFTKNKQQAQVTSCLDISLSGGPGSVMTWIRYLIIIHRCEWLHYTYLPKLLFKQTVLILQWCNPTSIYGKQVKGVE